MTPRRQLRIAFGAYLDSLERKMRETVQEAVASEQEHAVAVAVKMRQHMIVPFKTARWECNLAGRWISGDSIHTTTQDVRDNGNAWLARLGEKLGIIFVPEWLVR